MTENTDRVFSLEKRALFPTTDEQVLKLIPDFAWAVARSAAATVLSDKLLTTSEYEALAASASSLEGLSSFPGLMSFLILKALGEEPSLGAALKELRKTTRRLPVEARQAILGATREIHLAQGDDVQAVHDRWAKALEVTPEDLGASPSVAQSDTDESLIGIGRQFLSSALEWLPSGGRDPDEELLEGAKLMAAAFKDRELAEAISGWESSETGVDQPDLHAAIARATERAFAAASARLKSPQDLQQQGELAERFLHTTQALIAQVRSRLLSVEARLQMQCEMFDEDLEVFVDRSLDALEIEMGKLMKGRKDWTDPGVWESFKERGASAQLIARFSPVRRRYTRMFDQWQRELDSFSTEAGTIRASVLSSVDTRAFSALVPNEHSAASFKCAIDRVSDATLGVSALGVLGAGAAAAAGMVQVGVVVAALANPVGATIGAVVGAAALWKVAANVEGRKENLIKDKKGEIKKGLRQLLKSEGLNHDEMASEVLGRFVEAAVEQYTPLIVEARLWAMKARLEPSVTERVLEGTRSVLALSDASGSGSE